MTPENRQEIDDEVTWSLLDSLRTLHRARGRLLAASLAGLALGLLYAVVAPPYFKAEAVFLPPRIADLSGPASSSAALLLGSSDQLSDTFLGLLESRTVQDDVIDQLHLIPRLHARDRDQARALLHAASHFAINRNSFVALEITSSDRRLAPAIANAYLDALYRLNGQMADSASAHRSAFFEAQLETQKNALAQAELDLKTSQERTGLVSPTGQVQAGISATASLEAQLNAAEARRAQLALAGTAQNPQVVEARTFVDQLRGQLARQQAAEGSAHGLAPNNRLPAMTLEYARREREVKLRETLYDTLVQQYEKARLSSLDPGPQLQIVDRAVIPEHKSGPSRKLALLLGLALGLLAGLTWIFAAPPLRRLAAALREPA